MPCPHNQISIVQRSNRQSAVAAAAYQSGETVSYTHLPLTEPLHYLTMGKGRQRAGFT